MRTRVWTGVLLIAAVSAVFYRVLGHEFVRYDDFDYIVQNSLLRMSWFDAFRLAFETQQYNWIPLTWLSLRLDYALFALEPAGYHATNVLLHALSSVLLYGTLVSATKANARCAFVAACFAIHPLHVESVAWATERKDVLAGFFWILTLFFYVRYHERSRDLRGYLLVVSSLALGLLSKPVVVTLPFALLLFDYWPLARLTDDDSDGWPRADLVRKAVVEKIPLFALVLAASILTYLAQRGAMRELQDLSLGWRLSNSVVSYWSYVFDTIWPTNLAVFYPHPMESASYWWIGLAVLLLFGVTAALGRLAAGFPYAIVGWLWFLGTLVPMLGIVQVGMQARADRYMYIPLIGLAILVAWGAVDIAKRLRVPDAVVRTAGAVAILSLGAVSWVQVGSWRNTESLYSNALAAVEGNYVAHKGLANELLRMGHVEPAISHYEAAIRLKPDWQSARLGLSDVAMVQGRSSEALRLVEKELRRTPDNSDVYGRYGLILGEMGRNSEARVHLRRAVAARPGMAELRRALAQIESALGNLRAAIEQGRECLRLAPDHLEAANNLAWILATAYDPELRDPRGAIDLVEAAALESDDHGMLDTLAAAYAADDRFSGAVATARRAVELAERSQNDAAAREYRRRAALYRAEMPYIEPRRGTASR